MQWVGKSMIYSLGLGLALAVSCLKLFETPNRKEERDNEIRIQQQLRLLSIPPVPDCGLLRIPTAPPERSMVYHSLQVSDGNRQDLNHAERLRGNDAGSIDDDALSTHSWANCSGGADDFVYSHDVSTFIFYFVHIAREGPYSSRIRSTSNTCPLYLNYCFQNDELLDFLREQLRPTWSRDNVHPSQF